MLKKMWKKKKENVSSMSSESQKKAKDLQWCKYTVMKRRAESLLDLAESTATGVKTRPQNLKKYHRREKRGDCNLLKKVLYWNHIKSDKAESEVTE